MKAVILVGGLGTRLRPLTCRTPKPMIPLVNRPFIEHVLMRLRAQGITEIVLAVQYLAEQFQASLGDGSRFDIKLHIVQEPEPRGTAGAVKNVEHLLNETCFVFNGDLMTDLDLQAMMAYHREKGSMATISLTPVDDPTQFGLVEMDGDNRVQRFLEKPRLEDVTTNMINAGSYILEPEVFRYVPPDAFFMFERGLFPVLLQTGDPMYGYPSRSYWSDIGRPQNYLEVSHDILIGRIDFQFPGEEIANRVWVEEGTTIHDSVQIIPPVVCGRNVRIARGARIIGPVVIGHDCVIGPESSIESTVLWNENTIEEGATLRSCVVGHRNTIGARSVITGGAIVSDDCSLGAENRLDRSIKLWPGTTIQDQGISF